MTDTQKQRGGGDMRVRIVSPNGALIDQEVRMKDITDVIANVPNEGDILKYNSNEVWECSRESAPPPVSYNDRGDPSSVDFSKTDFTTNGEWHVLNLSGIVPEGATLVHLLISANTAYNNSWIRFCKKGIVNKINADWMSIRHGNTENYESKWVACDADRKIEYWMSNQVWIQLDVLVRGWFA